MSSLTLRPPTEQEEAAAETTNSSIRADVAKKVAGNVSLPVGVAILLGAFEVFRNDPHEAFPLLQAWGPRVVIGLVLIYVLYDLVKMALNICVRLVHAIEKLAVAQEKSADKDDRQLQEVQTLTALTAQRSERAAEIQQRYHEENQTQLRNMRHDLRNWQQEVRDGLFVHATTAKALDGTKGTPTP